VVFLPEQQQGQVAMAPQLVFHLHEIGQGLSVGWGRRLRTKQRNKNGDRNQPKLLIGMDKIPQETRRTL